MECLDSRSLCKSLYDPEEVVLVLHENKSSKFSVQMNPL
jgi:hypothetical protein